MNFTLDLNGLNAEVVRRNEAKSQTCSYSA